MCLPSKIMDPLLGPKASVNHGTPLYYFDSSFPSISETEVWRSIIPLLSPVLNSSESSMAGKLNISVLEVLGLVN
jgi:hypothetical protein